MDFDEIQRGQSCNEVHRVLQHILDSALSIIEDKENSSIFLEGNTIQTLLLMQHITSQFLLRDDSELSLNSNWDEDIEPTRGKVDSLQAFRVPTTRLRKQNQSSEEEKQVNVPVQKIKIPVDINSVLAKELHEEKQRLQRQYIDKYSQLTFISKGSQSPSPLELNANTTLNIESFKPWELSFAHFKAKQDSFIKLIKETDEKTNNDSSSVRNPKFFIRKILAKEAIKKATEKAEEMEKEKQINPKESQNLYQKIVKYTLLEKKSRSSQYLESKDELEGSGGNHQNFRNDGRGEGNEEEEKSNEHELLLTDFFPTQIRKEEDEKLQTIYFKTIGANSPSSVKPFNLRKEFPKAHIPKLIDAPVELIRQKFQKDNIQKMEERIAKNGKPTQVDTELLKKMKNIRVRSNSPVNHQQQTRQRNKQDDNMKPHLQDNIKYLLNPNLKNEEEARSTTPKILPEVDFMQTTRFKFSNRLKFK